MKKIIFIQSFIVLGMFALLFYVVDFYQKQLTDKIQNSDKSYKEAIVKIDKNMEKLSIIEQSIDPKNYRWSKIKKIREVILISIKEEYIQHNLSIGQITDIASFVYDYSEEYNVETSLIMAIIRGESGYNVKAISKTGAMGLTQVMPDTAKEIADDIGRKYYNLYKIKDSVQFGTWYIAKMLNLFEHNVELAVRSYNCGPMCVEKVEAKEWSRYPIETQEYVIKILNFKKYFEEKGL